MQRAFSLSASVMKRNILHYPRYINKRHANQYPKATQQLPLRTSYIAPYIPGIIPVAKFVCGAVACVYGILYWLSEGRIAIFKKNWFADDAWGATVFLQVEAETKYDSYRPCGVVISEDGRAIVIGYVPLREDHIALKIRNVPVRAKVLAFDPLSKVTLLQLEQRDKKYKYVNLARDEDYGKYESLFIAPYVHAQTEMGTVADVSTSALDSENETEADRCRLHHIKLKMPHIGGPVFDYDSVGNSGLSVVVCVGLQIPVHMQTTTKSEHSYMMTARTLQYIVTELTKHGYVSRPYLGMSISDHQHVTAEVTETQVHTAGTATTPIPNTAATVTAPTSATATTPTPNTATRVTTGTVDGKSTYGVTKEIRHYVRIDSVVPNSPAEASGLKSGDVLVSVDEKDTTTVVQVLQAIGLEVRGNVTMVVERQGSNSDASLQPTIVKIALTPLSIDPRKL